MRQHNEHCKTQFVAFKEHIVASEPPSEVWGRCTLHFKHSWQPVRVSQPVWHSAQLHTECAVSHADFIVASNAVKWKVGGGARCITATRLNGCTAGCTAGGVECPLQSAREATYTAAAQQLHSALALCSALAASRCYIGGCIRRRPTMSCQLNQAWDFFFRTNWFYGKKTWYTWHRD